MLTVTIHRRKAVRRELQPITGLLDAWGDGFAVVDGQRHDDVVAIETHGREDA